MEVEMGELIYKTRGLLQEYWSGLPFPPAGELPNPGIELVSPALQADSLLLSHQGDPYNT